MAARSLEERIQLLEEINEKQSQKLQRLEAVHEIANLMGRYIYGHEVQKDPEFADTLYARKTPGVSWEVAHMGFYENEGIRRILDQHGIMGKAPGCMFMHTLTTPVIEVAGDGKTAKGVWISPGHETMPDPKTGEFTAYWAWTKYGCDFVKEDGKWKLWHYHVYRIFRTPYNMPWTDEYELKQGAGEVINETGGLIPDKPTTYDHPYSTTTEREYVPVPPEPYETFDQTFRY